MTTTRTEAEDRADLMQRLRDMASYTMVLAYKDAPLDDLRRLVENGEAQLKFYADCGFEDMGTQAPGRAA